MKSIRPLLSVLLLAGTLGWSAAPVGAQEGILFKVAANPQSDYCHMKFPAIREDTLTWARPVLKGASSGDIVDFYGSCSHDPLGKEELRAQVVRWQRDRDHNTSD